MEQPFPFKFKNKLSTPVMVLISWTFDSS